MKQTQTINPGDLHETPSTITLGVTKLDGNKGFVTSSHGVTSDIGVGVSFEDYYLDDSELKQSAAPQTSTIISDDVGDIAFISITEMNISVSELHVKKLDGHLINVQHGSTENIPIGSSIELIGSVTNSEGTLKYKNVTAFKEGQLFRNVGVGHYNSINGDSGGPIISVQNGYKLVGVHQGFLCTFSTYSLNLGVVLQDFKNIERFCPPDASSHFKLFTPWENEKNAFGL